MLDHFRPHQVARHLTEIDCHALYESGVRGVILDLDNTITAWRSLEVSPEVAAWIDCAHDHGMKTCVVSNAATTGRVQPVAALLGIPWVTRAAKPLPMGFWMGMRMMDTIPTTTAVVGDQVFTDIWGGNSLGLYTILVEPHCDREALVTKILQRPLERMIGRVPKEMR